MTLAVFLLLCAAVLLIQRLRGYSISFYGFPHFSVPPNDSSVERGGLRLTIKKVERVDGKLRIDYALEWIRSRPMEMRSRLMRPFGQMKLAFWDREGRELFGTGVNKETPHGEIVIEYGLGDFAADTSTYLHEDSVTVFEPRGSKWVALMLSKTLATRRVSVPDP